MKNNDRGFTLVELIVSCAILGIISVAVMGFMSAGTRTYSYVNYSVRLQYESQLAMNQIQNYVINCNEGIAYDVGENTLYIVNKEVGEGGTETLKMYVYTLDSENGRVLFGSGDAAKIPISASDVLAQHLVQNNPNSMSATFSILPDKAHASAADITLEFELGGKTYTGRQTIALRNQPKCADSWDELFEALNKD